MSGAHSLSEMKEGKSVTEENPEWARQKRKRKGLQISQSRTPCRITGEQNPADKLLRICYVSGTVGGQIPTMKHELAPRLLAGVRPECHRRQLDTRSPDRAPRQPSAISGRAEAIGSWEKKEVTSLFQNRRFDLRTPATKTDTYYQEYPGNSSCSAFLLVERLAGFHLASHAGLHKGRDIQAAGVSLW